MKMNAAKERYLNGLDAVFDNKLFPAEFLARLKADRLKAEVNNKKAN